MDKSYKRKNYYNPRGGSSNNNWSKKKFKNYLQPGMKGFICTCNMREKDCIRESYNILNEYADKLYGPEQWRGEAKNGEVDGAGDDAAEDIEDELKKEVSSLKAHQHTPSRFSTADTGVKNNIFVKTTLEDPVALAYTILNDVATTKTQKARFLLRIVPVEATCRANLEEIKTAADGLFDKYFKCEPTTFAVVINKRYNDSLLRDEVIHAVALLVTDRNRDHKANLKEAKMTVLLEVMKGLCCITVLQDYKRLRHYNLAELAKPDTEKPGSTEAAGEDEQVTDNQVEPEEQKLDESERSDNPQTDKSSDTLT